MVIVACPRSLYGLEADIDPLVATGPDHTIQAHQQPRRLIICPNMIVRRNTTFVLQLVIAVSSTATRHSETVPII